MSPRKIDLGILGPDGNPIQVNKPDPERPCGEHVEALFRKFGKTVHDAGQVGVGIVSVLEALVQVAAKIQVMRGLDPESAVTQIAERFLPLYVHFHKQEMAQHAKAARDDGESVED